LSIPTIAEPRGAAQGVVLRDPRATKSFREAGDRIVRQDPVMSPSIDRLLGAPARTARRVTTDADAWDVRLTALATLAQYDGLTFVIPAGTVATSAAYNLVDDPMTDPTIRDAIERAAQASMTVQVRASVPLADGRMASAVLVTPFAPTDALRGVLLALRVGRPFAAVDAYTAEGVAEIVSLELSRSIAARLQDDERRQALALYELARHALFTDDIDEALQGIAMMLTSSLGHDAAHVWLRRQDGSLRRHAAYPPEDPVSDVWPSDHHALWGALRERRLVRSSVNANAAWIPSNTGEVLVVPLRGDARPLGVLVLAQAERPYGLDDIEMGDVLGTFIGRIVTTRAGRHIAATPDVETGSRRTAGDLEGDPEFVESRQRSGG
jgi:GTP-sensing pleiotropic transcriptional regulator CodY